MEEVKGVKELKEAIIGFAVLGKAVADLAKDGVDFNDAAALAVKFASDEAFKAKLVAAVQGIDQVPAEIKDLKFAEILELAQVLPEILDLFKKA